MKPFNRILAVLLAALMLCGMLLETTLAESNLEFEKSKLNIQPSFDELEISLEDASHNSWQYFSFVDDTMILNEVAETNPELKLDEIALEDAMDQDVNSELMKNEIEDSGKCGNNVSWELDDKGTMRIYGQGKMNDYYVNYYDDTRPYDVDSIRKIVIENGVTRIGEQAFCWSDSLTSITISNSVTSIGVEAFWDCDVLNSVTIKNGVANIEERAFWGCNSLTSVTIPTSVTNIGLQAFDCDSLTDVTILAKKINIEDDFGMSDPIFHIIEGSDAIKWAEENDYDYDIIKDGLSEKSIELVSGFTHKLIVYDVGKKVNNVTWSSSDKSIATVDNGMVTGKKVGKCVISAKIEDGKTLKCNVTVYDPAELNVSTLNLNLGESYKLKVTDLLKRKITWASSNTAIATVKNGKITPKKAGKCRITATLSKGKYLEKKTLTCQLTVTDPAALSAEKLTISTIDSATIKLTGALKRKVTWSTSNSGVVKITNSDSSAATIKAVKTGTATITAKVKDGKTLKCVVTVKNPLTIVEDWDDGLDDLSYWEVGLKLINNSNKKIVYVTFDIYQYDNRGQKLQSPYDYYYFNNDIEPHDYCYSSYTVNDDTRSIKLKVREVTFADKTTWRP